MNAPPELLTFPVNVDEWEAYLDEVYKVYLDTVIRPGVTLWGKPLKARHQPVTKGKHFAFWHLISEGRDEEERTPDPQRCERIGWLRWVLDNEDDVAIPSWSHTVSTPNGVRERWVLWARDYDYAVIVEERSDYILLITAFVVQSQRRAAYEKQLAKLEKAPK